ncbi:glycosyltransferase [Pengzhenrongella sicca]|uniref:D-inositol 3-phosphate glycosyltransferase n=1 Tax=Pengzhenrongella sicca TaxID=2819238 RepID=A0A8A4ZCA0_9MICO|nr:glycosyltransferase [Pengzhenrongella sicca]QTE28216.1 glycosyltransferase [Pengzhenrongella sicca]
MGTDSALDAMRHAPSILAGIRAADALAVAATHDGGARAVRLLVDATRDPDDQLVAIGAVHALAQVVDPAADDALVALLRDRGFLAEHAAWALGARRPQVAAVSGLVRMAVGGGFGGMLAQRTLEQWAPLTPDHLVLALEGALLGVAEPAARARLVETLGLVPGRLAEQLLRRVADDDDEGRGARIAAVAALGDRSPSDATLALLTASAQGGDELADAARLALFDLTARPRLRAPWSRGATVAQLFLPADLDRELAHVGAGDNGGIATLLVRLGDALVATDEVERVVTISRGRHDGTLAGLLEVGSTLPGHAFATVPFVGPAPTAADAWPQRVAAQRGLRRVLRAAGPVDAIHLRMADVGSLAAAAVARELELPVVFTVAPDPHVALQALEDSGALTRATFGGADAAEHYWFKVRLVQRLAADAAHLVLFPRPDLERDLRTLVGLDLEAAPRRHSVVAEGIDLGVIERAGRTVAALPAAGDLALDSLDALLRTLPAERRTLPLAVTVGRLHRVKGMAALVAAWAADPDLRDRCNLLVVGGDLADPSEPERGELAAIESAVPLAGAPARGLLLAGHRPNSEVASWLAAARYGRPGLAAPHGAYVCASVKEEFGIALLEALAAGLPVVAPAGGGPATYVADGVTGFLVNTTDGAALAAGLRDALALAAGPSAQDGAGLALELVRRRFTIGAMARALAAVYRDVSAHSPADLALSLR